METVSTIARIAVSLLVLAGLLLGLVQIGGIFALTTAATLAITLPLLLWYVADGAMTFFPGLQIITWLIIFAGTSVCTQYFHRSLYFGESLMASVAGILNIILPLCLLAMRQGEQDRKTLIGPFVLIALVVLLGIYGAINF